MTAVPVDYGAERHEIEGGEKLGGEVMHGGLVVRGSRIYDRRCSQTTKRADLESKEMEAETQGTNTHKEPSILYMYLLSSDSHDGIRLHVSYRQQH